MDSDDTLAQLNAGKLVGAKHIKISAGLTHFPAALYTLADTLEILDLTGNQLSNLPDDLTRFKQLRILFCSSNQFKHLPEVLGACENLSMIGFKANQIAHIAEHAIPTMHLRWFIVTDNQLERLPDSLGDCAKLQKLMLAGNRLSRLPERMQQCKSLELLRIAANRFESLPPWLLGMPKLAWLAYAGNPFNQYSPQLEFPQSAKQVIDWSKLQLQHVLGEGASGITCQAVLHSDSNTKELVAVKLFKAGMTSDGLPDCEMQASLLAGEHPNLVGAKGVISRHPEGKQGLVMALLDSNLAILAGPPSFDSCTRDVYAPTTKLRLNQAAHIAKGVWKAMQHLHANGILHGDLYAHNILWSDEQVVLSDLGGASLLPLADVVATEKLIALDRRAFSILLEELAHCCDASVEELSQCLNGGGLTP
jgi:hypothetical protein